MSSEQWPVHRLKYEISVLEDLLYAIGQQGDDPQLRWAKREITLYLDELRSRLLRLRLSA